MSRDFWARRKAAVEAEAAADLRAEAAAEAALREQALEEKSDEEILAELELPDPDTLDAGDDFKVFLRDAVPARIRTRALRRLWRLNPVLANIDGLVDYGEDFTDSAMVVEGMQTAYQVGKGMTKHVQELARQAAEKADAEAAAEDVPPAEVQADTAVLAEAEMAEALMPLPQDEAKGPVAAQPEQVAAAAPGRVTSAGDWNDTRSPSTSEADRGQNPGDTDPGDTLPRRMRFSFEQTQGTA